MQSQSNRCVTRYQYRASTIVIRIQKINSRRCIWRRDWQKQARRNALPEARHDDMSMSTSAIQQARWLSVQGTFVDGRVDSTWLPCPRSSGDAKSDERSAHGQEQQSQ